tara:strand:- start:82 stop:837 length:756 start_codon:yes stop_codon:yes gene_type:complete
MSKNYLQKFKRVRRRYMMPFLSVIKNTLNTLKQYALPDYKRPQSIFQMYENEEIQKCYINFKKHFKTSLFLDTWKLREHAINKAIDNDKNLEKTYIEFGVFSGSSINFFSKFLKEKEIYGFDSFEGLKEDWVGTSVTKGTFDLKNKIPKLEKNIIPVKGWIDQTLPRFLNEKNPKINFMHIDVDTYETTKIVLELTKKFLEKGAVIVFDELYNFPGWDVGEYKALKEIFNDEDYIFLSFAKNGQQAAIQIN